MTDPDPPVVTDPEAATRPPIGVSTGQIFAVAIIILVMYGATAVIAMWKGGEGERTAFEQSSINLALLAAGFYLGSSASSRNKDHR